MQYLLIDNNETLRTMSRSIGQTNADIVLVENSLPRTPNVGKAWANRCDKIIAEHPNNVTPSRKAALLNGLTNSVDVFEKACLMDEDEWKVFSSAQAFFDALKIPETVKLPNSTRIMGSSSSPIASNNIDNVTGIMSTADVDYVSSTTYRSVMASLKSKGSIDPDIFESVNTMPDYVVGSARSIRASSMQYSFNLPWGKIQMYSTLLKELIDFPAYPEEVETSRAATYVQMPSIIYQYEPWIAYQESGPRDQPLTFHLHRDMWSGNHLDGKANQLVRFCEANTFPDYSGSAVIPPYVRFYVDGTLFISGVIKNTTVNWSGPIGLDNWYLEFTLSMVIQEISETELNVHSVYAKKIKEG